MSKLRGDRGPSGFKQWVSQNWPDLVMLFILFFLAMFVRSFYGYSIAEDNGYLVSGGSDSYYWQRILEYNMDTGKQLYWDPLINYPDGIRNPRPPLFSFAIVVPAVIIQDMFATPDDSLGWTLMMTPAFWGALTIIPLYFIGKESFSRRVGLVAAFFLAVMPSHIQRSVLSDADHDSFILFLIVLTFFFLLRAVKTQQHKKWVENWRSWSSIRGGLKDYFANSRKSVLYSLMAGTAFGGVVMAWVGFGYAAVIILVYYVIQVLINKFKNIDSLSVTIIVALSLGFGFLMSFPVYYYQTLIPVRFDVPVYLWAASLFLGMMFVVSRDYPWTLTFPAIIAVLAMGIFIVNIVDPALAEAILSGQGYFVQNKLYSTIAEARAPAFSEIALGFGAVTFFMSVIGLAWAFWQIPKHAVPDYIFLVVWLGASIFMAISAGRFMFNAGPAFALASAWVLVIIVDRLDFLSVRKSIMGASGSYLRVMRKSIKIRHVVGVLFLAFLVVLPNVWFGTDAGIPQQIKADMDREIYQSMPSFLRPSGYDVLNGTMEETGDTWYLGAFGYSLPLPSYYFPAAWDWFAETDADILPESQRPAYVAWWDYGFEAVQDGKHPTVADNFQNGYQLTGNIIVGDGETDAIAVFAYRLASSGVQDPVLKPGIYSMFERHGLSSERMDQIIFGPTQNLIDEILASPDVYGSMAPDLTEINARIVAGRTELESIGLDQLVLLYDELCDYTGWSIRYFMADSRMMPLAGTNTGIFYAPAKLSDRRIENSIPIDYYTIKAVDQYDREYDLEDLTADMIITNYKIVYQDGFYSSMFYKAMCGYAPAEIGLANDGLPGYSGTAASYQYQSAPGWNLTHFRMVYRTAYYNPYPADEYWKHSDAWTAVSLEEALDLNDRINAGEIEGVVDYGTTSFYRQGAVFLKYYAGAYVNGTVTTEEGYPVANLRVTVQDEYGIPHNTILTDSNGQYSLLAPFGNVTLTFSTGDARNVYLQGETLITQMQFNVTDDQAMRKAQDLDMDGVYDYIFTKDFVMKGSEVSGDIFWDLNKDGNYTSGTDELITDLTVYALELDTNETYEIDASDGSYSMLLPPGRYSFSTVVNGVQLPIEDLANITAGVNAALDLPIQPAKVSGSVVEKDGSPAAGIEVKLLDTAGPYTSTMVTNSRGNFSFDRLVVGSYVVTTTEEGSIIYNEVFTVAQGASSSRNVTILPSATINVAFQLNGYAAPLTIFSVNDYYDASNMVTGQTDRFGEVVLQVPRGVYSIYGLYHSGSGSFAALRLVDVSVSDAASVTVALEAAVHVDGTLLTRIGAYASGEYLTFQSSTGARMSVQTDRGGMFDLKIPAGVYDLTCMGKSGKRLYSGTQAVSATSHTFTLSMQDAYSARGAIWLDKDALTGVSGLDLGSGAWLEITDQYGRLHTAVADADGEFLLALPQSATVTIRVADPGYSGWSNMMTLSRDTTGMEIVATPDKVLVTGYATDAGTGVREVQVAFMPDSFLLSPVYATTGAGGYFSAYLPAGLYKVLVDQYTNPMGGEKYLFETGSRQFAPSGIAYNVDVQMVKKVEVYGLVEGAGAETDISLDGPESVELTITSLNYSAFVLAGEYKVYAVSTVMGYTYANMSIAYITRDSRQFDLELERAYEVTGMITIGSEAPGKQVTVTAVSSTGEEVSVRSSTTGRYSVKLPTGTYDISYLLETTSTDGARIHYIEYFAEVEVSVASASVSVNVGLQKRWDNTTFSGTVFGPDGQPQYAFVQLVANTKYGENASFYTSTSGEFSELVQPGDYTVYVTRLQEKRATLTTVVLVKNVAMDLDITMEAGLYLSGTLTVAGSGASLVISVASGNAKLYTVSDSSGRFGLLLPSGNVTLSASTSVVENDNTISYSGSTRVSLTDTDVDTTFALTRSSKYTVTASWNKSQMQNAIPGDTVTYSFTIENTGNIADTYTLSFSGSGMNVSFSQSQVTLDFGTDNKATVFADVTVTSILPAGENKVNCIVKSSSSSAARASMDLSVNISVIYNVSVEYSGLAEPVSSTVTYTKFTVFNSGNVADNYTLQIANTETLASMGWSAELYDGITRKPVSQMNVSSQDSRVFMIKFTAIRSNPDPEAEAIVLVTSTKNPGTNAYGPVPVVVPDLLVGPGDIDVTRDDIVYSLDTSAMTINIGLVAVIAVLAAMFFYLRRKRGLSGGGAKK
ncbi:MAG: carboxypeptidase regulatory-like domain-containing protein [Thermoplasmata archaeon]|jgi:dolichyl-diphosphooligosaccharide--protein glycosyltransferase|nr:carboxypeptidase regulatory-like domain-containing protein [Thermoplasmata archaeon]